MHLLTALVEHAAECTTERTAWAPLLTALLSTSLRTAERYVWECSEPVRPRRRVPVERPQVGCSAMRSEVRHRVPMRSRSEVVFTRCPKGALSGVFPDETMMGVSAGWNKGSW